MRPIVSPIVSMTVSAKTLPDQPRLERALRDLAGPDPTILIRSEPADDLVLLCGMDELHLEQICNRIASEFGIPCDVGAPQVIYLETIRRSAQAEGKYIRHTGGAGNYGHVKIRVEPKQEGSGFEFANEIRGGVVPQEFVGPVEEGIREALRGGVLAGYEIVDVKATLFDGSFHDVDSNEMAFRIAGSMALKEAARKASPVVLEPMMRIEAVASLEHMSSVIADLNSLRGRIEKIEPQATKLIIQAIMPLSELLRSRESRRPEYTPRFLRYEAVSGRGGSGGDEAGVTANLPKRPGGRESAVRLREPFD
jgi:elongation factor G